MKEGDYVELRGLVKAAHLNGQFGTLIKLDSDRWIVRLDKDGSVCQTVQYPF